jgi:hypothetical protein
MTTLQVGWDENRGSISWGGKDFSFRHCAQPNECQGRISLTAKRSERTDKSSQTNAEDQRYASVPLYVIPDTILY